MFWRCSRSAALLVMVTAFAGDARAQFTTFTPGQFGIPLDLEDVSNTQLHLKPGLRFVEIPTGPPNDRIAGVTPRALGAFSRPHAIARIEIYLARESPPPDQRGNMSDDSKVDLIAATQDQQGRRRWWELVAADGLSRDELLQISDEPLDDESIELVAGPAIPLVRVRYSARSLGASTQAKHEFQLLIDFRAAQPSVPAAFEAWTVDGGGACGVWDNQFHLSSTTSCEWQDDRGDFLCTQRSARAETIWVNRTMRRQFWLSNDATQPARVPPADAARRLWNHAGDAPLSLAGMGDARPLLRGALPNGVAYRLFAIPGTSAELDATILAVVVAAGRPPQVVTPDRVARIPQPPDYPRDAHPDDVAEQQAIITASLISQQPDAAFFRVVVNEADAASVFVVALSHAAGAPRLDAAWLATNAEQYAACARTRLPESAAAVVVTQQPFSIAIDVEPPHFKTVADEPTAAGRAVFDAEEDVACGWTGRVTWDGGAGFAVIKEADACRPGVRQVIIDDSGVIRGRAAYRRATDADRVDQLEVLAMGTGDTGFLLLPDPDFRAAIWEPVLERLASTHLAITANVSNAGPGTNLLSTMPIQLDKVVASTKAQRLFVVAHWLSAAYVMPWAKLHPELIAGVLLLHPGHESDVMSRRLHATTGDDADRLAFARTLEPAVAAAVAANMHNHSSYLTSEWLELIARLMNWQLPADDFSFAPIWVVGGHAYGSRHINGPSRFGMLQDPAAFTAFLLDLYKKSIK